MPCTPPNRGLLVSQLIGSCCVLFGSVCVCICMAMHQDHFKGHCALFSTGHFRETDGQLIVQWASQAYCNFSIFVAVVSFLVGAGLTLRLVRLLYKDKEESFFGVFVDIVFTFFLTLMILIASIFLSSGSLKWCRQITKRFEHCADAAGNEAILHDEKIDTDSFYVHLTMAQFGNWLSFLGCFVTLVASTVKIVRYHMAENLRVTMMKARTKLIFNDDMVQDVPVMHRRLRSGIVADDEEEEEDDNQGQQRDQDAIVPAKQQQKRRPRPPPPPRPYIIRQQQQQLLQQQQKQNASAASSSAPAQPSSSSSAAPASAASSAGSSNAAVIIAARKRRGRRKAPGSSLAAKTRGFRKRQQQEVLKEEPEEEEREEKLRGQEGVDAGELNQEDSDREEEQSQGELEDAGEVMEDDEEEDEDEDEDDEDYEDGEGEAEEADSDEQEEQQPATTAERDEDIKDTSSQGSHSSCNSSNSSSSNSSISSSGQSNSNIPRGNQIRIN